VYIDVHNGHIKLQTTHNVQSVRQGFNNDWNSVYNLCTNSKLWQMGDL